MYSIGDIVLLRFKGNYKTNDLKSIVKGYHPVLLVEILEDNKVRIASMSSNQKQMDKYRPHDVVLDDWSSSGLKKKTYVNVSATGIIDDSNIFKVIGRLTSKDLSKVLGTLKNTQQKQILECQTIHNTGYPEYLDYYYDDSGNAVFMSLEDIT